MFLFYLEFGDITIGNISHINFTHLKIYFSFDDVFDYFERNYTILVNVMEGEQALVSLTVSSQKITEINDRLEDYKWLNSSIVPNF